MYAVFTSGGKQYFVKKGQVLKIEKVPGKKGDNLSFSNVLAISNGPNNIIGNPLVKGASIEATIINQIRDKKIIVFKKRRRKNYRSTQGHRQYLTVLKIESISTGSNKTNIKSVATDSKDKKIDKTLKEIPKKTTKKPIINKTDSKKTIKKKKITKKTVEKKITKSKK